jgi:microcystin-dependent protein
MSDQYLAEIRIFGGNFAPLGWALCNGQILPISQNTALFSLLGTTYGGDGRSNFALPNFQGMAPIQQGQGAGLSQYSLGQTGGITTVTLLTAQLPSHNHPVSCLNGPGNQPGPAGNYWADDGVSRGKLVYAAAGSAAMNAGTFNSAGAIQPHNNLPSYLTLTFIIALQGIYPPRG